MKDIDKVERLKQYTEEFKDYISDPDMLGVIASNPIITRIEEPTLRLQAAQRLGMLCGQVDQNCAGRYHQVLDLEELAKLDLEGLVDEFTKPPYNLKIHGLENYAETIVKKFIKVKAGCYLNIRGRALPPN